MIARDLGFGFGGHIIPLTRELMRLGVEVSLLYAGGDLRTLFMARAVKDADLVHIQGSPYNVLRSRKPTVVTIHTLLEEELKYSNKMNMRVGAILERRSLANADAVISVNSAMNDEIRKFSKAPIYTIPNGIDLEDTLPRSPSPSGLLSGGRLVPRKNFGFLIEAMKDPLLKDVYLTVFGDGPMRQSLEESRGANVYFMGFVDRMILQRLYSKSSAFVCTSLYESDPFTVLEAMAARCPVICGNHAWARQNVWGEGTVLFFDPASKDSLRDIILILVEDPTFSYMLAEKAYSFVKKERNWRDIAKRTIKVYEEILA